VQVGEVDESHAGVNLRASSQCGRRDRCELPQP
jgi:hypothetical protein